MGKDYKSSPAYKLLKKSRFFDGKWYLKQYPDVANAGFNPIRHYLALGWSEGRNPGPKFDTKFYLNTYPDVKDAQICPLLHYEQIGRFIGNKTASDAPSLLDDAYKILSHSKYFDKKWYLKTYNDVNRAKLDPVQHYLKYGWHEGRNPGPNFDTSGYLKRYPDCNINPILHYELYGKKQGYTTGKYINEEILKNYWKERNASKAAHIVMYSCVSGEYDEVITDFVPNPKYDYVLFTDSPKLLKHKTYLWWQIRPLAFSEKDSVRNARWHKLHPHVLFPEYTHSVWVDSNVQISGMNVYTLIDKHIRAHHKIAISLHPERDCIYDEANECIMTSKDNPDLINRQMSILRKDGFPAHAGLYETNLLLRRHMDPQIMDLCEQWWSFVCDYSRRDQLSFNYLLWKNGIKHYSLDKTSMRYHPEFKLVHHNYKPSVTKYSVDKILVHLHLFYHDQLDWFLKKLRNITCDYDLYVTVVEQNESSTQKLKAFKPDVHIIKVPNRGYDIYPFWLVLQKVDLDKYGLVLKVHTKNERKDVYVNSGYSFSGWQWRDALVNSLLQDKKQFVKNVSLFQDDTIGMIGHSDLIRDPAKVADPTFEKILKPILEKHIGQTLVHAPFICGTMFMVRSFILDEFKRIEFKLNDFGKDCATGMVADLAHGLERYFGILVKMYNKRLVGCTRSHKKKKPTPNFITGFYRCIVRKRSEISLVKHSRFFDKKWYMKAYPDVATNGMSAAYHYIKYGWRESRNPGPKFNTRAYLIANPDVARAMHNPLVHYERYGRFEGRKLVPTNAQMKTNAPVMNYRTYNDLAFDIKKNIEKLPTDIDLIVGIPRSGMIPAYIMGLALNKKVCSTTELVNGLLGNSGYTRKTGTGKIKNILVVDDTVNTGLSLGKVREMLAPLKRKYKIKYCAVYATNPEVAELVDVALNILPQPRMFQWNYLYHGFMANACFDMDGVLCWDPTDEQNDDGERYVEFVKTANPLFKPNGPIGYIVTSRLEKYRAETEQWLADHGIQYKKLYMFKGTAEERRRLGLHADFKASIYKQIKNSNMFIESNPKQAARIAELSGKPCICCLNDKMYL